MTHQFHDELQHLKEMLLRMSGMVEQSISMSVHSLLDKDESLAQKVIHFDHDIDMLEIELDEDCLKLLALHQPVATDLRFITAAMKITADLERMGDLAVNIAERAVYLIHQPEIHAGIDLKKMSDFAQKMVLDSLDALVRADSTNAREICKSDDVIDDMNHQALKILIAHMENHPQDVNSAVHMLLITRHLERIGDVATNICEEIVFMVEGKSIKHHIEEYR